MKLLILRFWVFWDFRIGFRFFRKSSTYKDEVFRARFRWFAHIAGSGGHGNCGQHYGRVCKKEVEFLLTDNKMDMDIGSQMRDMALCAIRWSQEM